MRPDSARSTSCTCRWARDVKMVMSSQDVIHSFFVPAFRVKADVLPGRFTQLWFRRDEDRRRITCSARNIAARDHSGMIGEVIVMEPTAYQAWLSGGGATGTLASNGQQLFQQLGCATCHRSDTQGRGPNLAGRLWQARCSWMTAAP